MLICLFQVIVLASLEIKQKKLHTHSGQGRNFAHPVPTPMVGRWTKQNPPEL